MTPPKLKIFKIKISPTSKNNVELLGKQKKNKGKRKEALNFNHFNVNFFLVKIDVYLSHFSRNPL